ncbi:MAG: sugar ABC transporter substrate-binding protein [Chloroflexi bacterium]|nr:sugar ABC transporter substrate-binding protein [Chloroflexota bacterium]
MFKYMRLFLILIVVVALLPLTISDTPAVAQDKVVLRMNTWAGVDEAAELQEIIDEVNANSESFEIVYEPNPADYYTQLQTQLAGGEAPDLFWLDQDHMSWAFEGVLLDISEYLANDDSEVANPEDYYEGIWNTVALNDGVYGLPWIAQPVVLYYNRAIFDEMGMDYPTAEWTWEDFQAAAVALTNEEHYGFAMNGWPPIDIFIWSYGGDLVSDDMSEILLNSEEAKAGAQLYADMIWNEECCPSEETIAEEGFAEMFKAGRLAMFMGGAADDLDRVEGLDVGVSPVPQGVNGENVTFAWSASTVINADTEHPDEAYEALVALTDGIHHWKIVSPRISQGTVEFLAEAEPRKEANAEAIIEALPYMRPFTIIPRFSEFRTLFWEEFQSPLFHEEDSIDNLADDASILLGDLLP